MNRLMHVAPWLTLAALLGFAPPAARAEKYALLVGVREYDKNELRSLQYPEDDVTDMAHILTDAGYSRVVLMTQRRGATQARYLPLADNIRKELKGLLDDRDPGDTVLVAVSGHGVQFTGDDTPYFCPMDAKLTDRKTLISLKEVYSAMEKSGAGSKVLLADCCRNDPQSSTSKGREEVQLESVTRPQREKPPGGVAALFACSTGERAFESGDLKHSVFFHFVMEGLKGKAALAGEKAVTLDGLSAYVKKKVNDQVKDEFGADKEQKPQLVVSNPGERVTLIGDDASFKPTTDNTKVKPPPDKPAPGGDSRTVAKTLRALFEVKPDPKKDVIHVGLCVASPLTADDLEELDQMATTFQRANAVATVVKWVGLPPEQAKQANAALEGTSIDAPFSLTTIMDRKEVDVLLIFGALREEKLPPDRGLPQGKIGGLYVVPGRMLELSTMMACNVGKDVYVETSKRDRGSWKPLPGDMGAAIPAEIKNNRIAWLGGDLEEFFSCVRSRNKQGSSDIRNTKE